MNEHTKLFRQINKKWIQNGRIIRIAFTPTPKDHSGLSVFNGDVFATAQKAFDYFTQTLSLSSEGVVHVTVADCQSVNLPAVEDNDAFQGHALILFNELTRAEIKFKSTRLTQIAESYGWDYKA